MGSGETSRHMQPQMVAQWITSLAVSIICCAVLFIIFAGYIVQLHDQMSLLSLKVTLLDERNVRQASEIERLRRGPSVQINTVAPQAVSVIPAENLVQPAGAAPVVQGAPVMPALSVAPVVPPSLVPTPAPAPAPQILKTPEKTEIVLPAMEEPTAESEEDAPPDVIVEPSSSGKNGKAKKQ